MGNCSMSDSELEEYLFREEQQTFQGWDISYLDGRWTGESLSWDYIQTVNKYRHNTDVLLDMGTGVYFAKQCVWEFPDFSVDRCFEELKEIGSEIDKVGYISNREHRFMIAARKNI